MEQGHDIIMRQQRRLAGRGFEEIAHQVGHRQLGRTAHALAAHALVHPGAAALVRSRARIEIEAAARRAVGVEDLEVAHRGMPHLHARALHDAHAEQPLRHLEQPGQHPRQRKPRAQLLLRDAVLLALQPLGPVADIPGSELGAGEHLEFAQLPLGRRTAGHAQLLEEREHLPGGLRHPRREGVVGVAGEIQQPRELVAHAQDVLHHRRVVPLRRRGRLVRRARRPGLVERAAQRRRSRRPTSPKRTPAARASGGSHPRSPAARRARSMMAGLTPLSSCGIGQRDATRHWSHPERSLRTSR